MNRDGRWTRRFGMRGGWAQSRLPGNVSSRLTDNYLTLGCTPSLAVIHEASYLPFVFSVCNDASGSPQEAVKLRGRRTWNKRGQEVAEGEVPPFITARTPLT